MSTGTALFSFSGPDFVQTSSDFALQDTVRMSTLSNGIIEVYDFVGSGGSVDEGVVTRPVPVPAHYVGNGVDVVPVCLTDGVSTGVVQWEISAALSTAGVAATSTNLNFGTVTDVNATPTGSTNAFIYPTAGAISHANLGSPTTGLLLMFQVRRDHDHATNTDSGRLVALVVTEST